MPGGFGFQRYPMRPSPPPNQVGSALEAQMLAGQQPGYHTPGYLPYGPSMGSALMGQAAPSSPMGLQPPPAGLDGLDADEGPSEPTSVGAALLKPSTRQHVALLAQHGVPLSDLAAHVGRGAL